MIENSNITSCGQGVVLITGGTGSFGKTMLEDLLRKGCEEVRILSRDEEKQDLLRTTLRSNNVRYYIGDIRDRDSVDRAMRGVDSVFHAAALKQVPSCEFFPMEAVRTNILGSENVIRSAVEQNVKSVVCLSTDKAVQPINSMGLSKAMMEKLAQALARSLGVNSNTTVSMVRYGNVMYSRGSVIPLFVDQLVGGKPITVTDPAMTRFMMTLEDAVELVLYAFANGKNGDIFVQKAPAATINTLANALGSLILKGAPPVHYIGTRHGEKQYEVLCSREEMLVAEDEGDYYRIPADNRDLNYAKYFEEGGSDLTTITEYNSHNTVRLNEKEMIDLLLKLEFVSKAAAGQLVAPHE